MGRPLQPKPRHPDLDDAWERYGKLIVWWSGRLKRMFGGEKEYYISQLYLKMNNDLWLFKPEFNVKFSTYFSTNMYSYLYRFLKHETERARANWANKYTTMKTNFKCQVFSEQEVNTDQVEYKDHRDYYNWAHEMMNDIGGREEAWKTITSCLDARSATILRRRYIHGETLEAIGQYYGLTRERIRQLEFLAIAKVRRKFSRDARIRKIMKRFGLDLKINASHQKRSG